MGGVGCTVEIHTLLLMGYLLARVTGGVKFSLAALVFGLVCSCGITGQVHNQTTERNTVHEPMHSMS